jgi:polysaccharide export outer membrane protein
MLRTVPVAVSAVAWLAMVALPHDAAWAQRDGRSPDVPAESTPDYLVGPGDVLQIFVWDRPELSGPVQVRPDGKISTALVEDLAAAGKSPTVLARDIESALAEYIRSPVVTVIVQSFIGDAEQQIKVVGQAAAPMALQYRRGIKVLDVVIAVGGLSEFAAGNRARIIREVDGKRKEIRVRLKNLINDGDIDENIEMLPGDVLVIPESVL